MSVKDIEFKKFMYFLEEVLKVIDWVHLRPGE